LKLGENLLGLRLGQFPERAAVLVDVGQERSNLRIDPRVGGGVGRRCGNFGHLGHENSSDNQD
jgi:hypothetical protein